MENRYFVYRHIRPDTNVVFYVGLGCYQKKWKYQRAYTTKNRNIHWQRIVKKCEGGFRVEILFDQLTKQQAVDFEIQFIKFYGRSDLRQGTLCNMTDGGEGVYNLSQESRKIISQKTKGRKCPHTEEWKRKMKGKFSGKNNPNYGKKIPEWHKEINRKAQLGRKKSQEEKDKIYPKLRKPVLNIVSGIVYPSLQDAAIAFNKSPQTITRWILAGNKNLKYVKDGNI
jgi:hypothetical protein